MEFKNTNALNVYIEKQVKNFLLEAGVEVGKVIKEYIQERFYDAYDPLKYDRTYQLLNSVTCTEVKQIGNTYQIEVYLNTDGVNYYSWEDGQRIKINPQLIFDVSSEGWHGAVQTEGKFMEEAKADLQKGTSYNIFDDFKKYLASKGIKVKGSIGIH